MVDIPVLIKYLREQTEMIVYAAVANFSQTIKLLLTRLEVRIKYPVAGEMKAVRYRIINPEGLKKYGFSDNIEALKAILSALKDHVAGRTPNADIVAQLIEDLILESSGGKRFLEKGGLLPMLKFIEKAVIVRDHCIMLEANAGTLTLEKFEALEKLISELFAQAKSLQFLAPQRPLTVGSFVKDINLGPVLLYRKVLAETLAKVAQQVAGEETKRREVL